MKNLKNLMTQKFIFGLLMACVLALGVQSMADALTFNERRTGDLQTIVTGNEFTVSFTVSLGSNTTPIRLDGNLVKDSGTDGGAANARIDSSGYLVFEATNGREYRLSTAANALSNTYILTSGAQPGLSTEPNQATTTSGTLYISGGSDTSEGSVFDSTGTAVYIRSGTGATDDPYQYTTARARPDAKVPDANRYHFNQEAISIAVPTETTLTKVGNYRVNVAGGSTHPMNELADSVNEDKLISSIRLTFTAGAVGERVITITDTTDAADRPGNISQPLSFTIFVVPALDTTTSLILAGAGANGYTIGNDLADQPVNTLFSGATNAPIVYTVEGSGRLYIQKAYTGDALGSPMSRSSAMQTLSTSSDADVFLDMNGSSNKVSAYVRDRNAAETGRTVAFIFNYATIEIISGNNQTGVPNSRLINPLGIRVKDSKGRAVPGLAVTFDPSSTETLQPVIGTDVYLTETNTWAAAFNTIVRTFQATTAVPTIAPDATDNTGMVPTDSKGEAAVYLKLGAASTTAKTVDVSAGGATKRFYAISSDSTDIPTLEIFSGNNQRSANDGKVAAPLVVRVLASNSSPLPQEMVTFTTTKGYLTTPSTYQATTPTATMNGPATRVTAVTDVNGKAGVSYDLVNHSGDADVIAEISATGSAPYQRRVTFTINGTGSSNQPTTRSPYLSISPSSLTGIPGQQRSFTVSAFDANNRQQNILVNLSSSGVTVPAAVRTGESVSITLPSSSTSISASASGYSSRSLSVSVQAVPDEIVKVSGDSPVQTGAPGAALSSPFVVRVEDSSNNPVPGQTVTFRVTGGGGSVSSSTDTTDSSGEAGTTLTLGSAEGTNTVEASVSGVSSVVTFTATAERVSVANRLEIEEGDNQSGELNRLLPSPLIVQLLDQDGDPIQGLTIAFEVTEGRGRLSPRTARTDNQGFAEVNFTPSSIGNIEVEASVRGIDTISPVTFTISGGEPPDAITVVSGNNQRGSPGARLANPFVVQVIDRNDDPVSGVSVSFSVTAGGGSVSPTAATTNNNGRAQTTLTLGDDPGENTVRASVTGVSPVTFKATSGAEVLLNASQRPPMYWISRNAGKLYRLVDDEIESLAPNLTGITNVAVDAANNVLYLSVQTGENRGDIRRANLNGGNVRTLKTITAVPRGITVDATGDTLYWANSRGRIQSMQTAGSTKLTNVLENLRNPTIVVSNGHLYWTESIGRIRRIDLTDVQLTIQNIATGLGEPLGLSVAKGKVYWIERNADGSGSLNRSNLDGSNVQALKTFASGVPTSLAVDSGDNKIYWTKGAGKIQRSNLAGKFVRDVASGVMNPTGIALSIAATDGTTATATPGTRNTEQANNAQMTYSRYDINRDGAVNNADTRAVAAAIGQSGADIANPRTDVDGSGTVDVTDLILVLGNLDDDVAAPTLAIDVKALEVDFDRVQEQVEVLLASGDASIAAQRALLYLQHLLASARPDETVLLANYPNPFNPETWIPYHLAESADVKISIYDAQGVLVRELSVGHQSAGYYTSRSRAAYWDGRNALGERVASGIYFYQLETDEMSPLRKMVILK